MFKKVGIIFFLLYYIAFMVVPNLPFVQYYYGQIKQNQDVHVLTNSSKQILVGDICFLKALADRTDEAKSKKDEAPPEPNNSNSLIYIVWELSKLNNINNCKDFKFKITNDLLTFRYLQIPSPPPKYLS